MNQKSLSESFWQSFSRTSPDSATSTGSRTTSAASSSFSSFFRLHSGSRTRSSPDGDVFEKSTIFESHEAFWGASSPEQESCSVSLIFLSFSTVQFGKEILIASRNRLYSGQLRSWTAKKSSRDFLSLQNLFARLSFYGLLSIFLKISLLFRYFSPQMTPQTKSTINFGSVKCRVRIFRVHDLGEQITKPWLNLLVYYLFQR